MTSIALGSSETLRIPWGNSGETASLEFPKDWPAPDIFRPDISEPVQDYSSLLRSVLDRPTDSPPLRELARSGAKVAIVVDDPSRWTPVREALGVVLERLERSGVKREDISINVGVGRHLAVDDRAMRTRVGDEVVDDYACHSPPVDDRSQYEDLGETPDGVPVRVFRPVALADLRILIGSVLPHLQAGFGGGYKLIFPGASHRSTLGAIHARGLSGAGSKLLGAVASENPMRRSIREAAKKIGPCFSISHLLGPPGRILAVEAGLPDSVQDRLADLARRRFLAPEAPPADLLIVGNHPWPGDPMQSFKVLLQHRAACRPNGVLAGFFWTDASEIDRSFPLPLMKIIAGTGSLGGWAIRRGLSAASRLAAIRKGPSEFLIRWAKELVADRSILIYSPVLREKIGPRLGPVLLFDDPGRLWKSAERALGNRTPDSIRAFPSGGLSYRPESPKD